MAVFGAVISYALQMLSFVLLRVRHPQMARPFRSPWGIPGAILVGLISIVTLIVLFTVPAYQDHLVAQAPEEEFALLMEASKDLKR
jgi:ethanolamine permease